MTNWKICSINDIGVVVGGGTPSTKNKEFWDGDIVWLTPKDMSTKSRRLINSSSRLITDKGLVGSSARILPVGSVLFTSRAPIGYLGISEVELCTNQGFKSIIPGNNVNHTWLYYWLKNKTPYLQSLGSGSTFAEISGKTLKEVEIELPPLKEQKAIAEVLSSLDDKIELLQKQNETLEALAQTLFRQWFIEEAHDSWEEYKVGICAEIIKTSVKPEANPDMTFEHYSLPAYDNQQNPSLDLGIDIKSNKYKVINEVVLISKLNPGTSRVWLILNEAQENSICSTEFVVVKPNSKEWLFFIYCLLSSNETSEYLGSCASGTSGSHQRVNPIDVLNLNFSFNNIESIRRFGLHVQPFFEKISMNRKSMRTLEQTRDTLLPKLMSGQVRVKLD